MGPRDRLLTAEDLKELLSNSRWIQNLARRLVADADVADDIVQQTYLAALRSLPRRGRLRPWLGQVMRNFARMSRRERHRRRQRELLAARSIHVFPYDELESHETRRTLVEAVLSLRQPYQRTIILRYFG